MSDRIVRWFRGLLALAVILLASSCASERLRLQIDQLAPHELGELPKERLV